MEKETIISDRIQMLIQEFSNGVNSQFAKLIGVNESNIRSYLAGTQPKFDVLSAIAGKLAINCEWLLTGKGNMLKEQEQQNSSPICIDSVNIESAPTVKQLPIGEIPHTPEAIPFAEAARNGLNPIPLVTTRVAAGFGCADFAIEEADIKDYYVIPKFKNCHVDFMIEITGLSMYPHFNSGDVIACSILRNTQFLQWNKCHVIATREQGMLVKRIMPGEDKEHLRAISDNKDYPPFEIPVDEITGIAVVIGAVCLE